MSYLTKNLEALSHLDPALADALRQQPSGSLTVTASKQGPMTATRDGVAIHSAYDPLREAEAWAAHRVEPATEEETLLVSGVGLLYHVLALVARAPSRRVTVLVADLGELVDALTVQDLTPWLPRLTWIWGPLEQACRHLSALPTPVRRCLYTPAVQAHKAFYDRCVTYLDRCLATRADGRLRIVVVGPIDGGSWDLAHYTTRALQGLGHEVRWIDHRQHLASSQAIDRLTHPELRRHLNVRFLDWLGAFTLASVFESPPDLVLALAQAPLTLPVLTQFRKKRLVTAFWFMENSRHFSYWQQVASGYDHWFVFQQAPFLQALRDAGAPQVTYLPVAADPDLHAPLSLTPADQAEFGADVAFLGAGYANRRGLLPRLLSPDWTFKLWGTEWGDDPTLRAVLQRNGDRIDQTTARKIYQATTINLNLHSWSGQGLDPHGDFVNPRTFELAAMGAFQLMDQRTLLPDLFPTDCLATFRTPDEIPSLIRRYLHDQEARQALASAARAHTLAHHTYRHRMTTLLQTLGLANPDRLGTVLRGDREAQALHARASLTPALQALLVTYPSTQRVDLPLLAKTIRTKPTSTPLSQDELLILLLDEYRQEMRDIV